MGIFKNMVAVLASAAVGSAAMTGCAVESGEPAPEDETGGAVASEDVLEQVGETSEALTVIGSQYTGACSGTSGQWAGCRGNGCAVCQEKFAGYDVNCYINMYPKCAINDTCNGSFYTCNSNCPPPPSSCRLCTPTPQQPYCPVFNRMGTGTTSTGASCAYSCDYWKLGLPSCYNTTKYCRRSYCSSCGPAWLYYWGA